MRILLKVFSFLVALAMLLPLGYLVVRAGSVGLDKAVDLIASERTLAVIGNSAALAVAVTLASLVLSLPLAWLTVRTDLPWRRGWTNSSRQSFAQI